MEEVVFYDQVEIEDFDFDASLGTYFYPCPCGDRFQVTLEELREGEDTARCPSCSLMVRVIYDRENFQQKMDSRGVFEEAVVV